MKSSLRKLMASVGLLVTSLTLVVTVSFAWYSMSGSPEVAGISIMIGGKQTIQIAPDMTEEVDGQTLHYPGYFQENLHLSQLEQYRYLWELSGLLPISTADGRYWFMPSDEVSERFRTLDDYVMDDTMAHANMKRNTNTDKYGNYIYVDFWIVSPMDNCEIRLAAGNDGQGSYLIGLPGIETAADGSRSLSDAPVEAAASARVGFMANSDRIIDGSMSAYMRSYAYDERYTSLKGIYQEQGNFAENYPASSFMIWEPNGNVHPNAGFTLIQTEDGPGIRECKDGDYDITQPIAYENGQVVLKDISDSLFVQKKNYWKSSASGLTLMSEIFKGYVNQNELSELSDEELLFEFYEKSLQRQFSPYLTPGEFYADTDELYETGYSMGESYVSAVEDAVIVTLEKNVPQRIRMYIWLEGQDIDCVREAAMDSFALGLELAGSTE